MQDQAVRNAVLCLESQDVTDTYTLSLMAYAYTLWDAASRQRTDVIAKLDAMIVTNGT